FDSRTPERSIPALLSLLEDLEGSDEDFWKQQKINEVQDTILACGGNWFESDALAPKVAVSEQVEARTDFIVRGPGLDIRVDAVQADGSLQAYGQAERESGSLVFNQLFSLNSSFLAEQTTQPYWLRKPLIQARFDVNNQLEIGSPGNIDGPGTIV